MLRKKKLQVRVCQNFENKVQKALETREKEGGHLSD